MVGHVDVHIYLCVNDDFQSDCVLLIATKDSSIVTPFFTAGAEESPPLYIQSCQSKCLQCGDKVWRAVLHRAARWTNTLYVYFSSV